jgi:hypothetical protein
MYDETVKRGDALSISESKGLGTLLMGVEVIRGKSIGCSEKSEIE